MLNKLQVFLGMMPAEEMPVSRQAEEPFNKRNAEVVLRTSDKVDFYVWRGILAAASPFFDDMFALPQVGSKRKRREAGEVFEDGKPVISVTETSKTLRSLLLFCYPHNDPVMMEEVDICNVLEAARKYDMEEVAGRVLIQFVTRAQAAPYDMFALAFKHRWGDEMLVAAKACLAFSPPSRCPRQFADVRTAIYFELLRYRQECCRAVHEELVDGDEPEECQPTMPWASFHDAEVLLGFEFGGLDCCDSVQWVEFDTETAPMPIYLVHALTAMAKVMVEFPHGSLIDNPDWILRTAASVAPTHCGHCSAKTYENVAKCASLVAKRVEIVTSTVSI